MALLVSVRCGVECKAVQGSTLAGVMMVVCRASGGDGDGDLRGE